MKLTVITNLKDLNIEDIIPQGVINLPKFRSALEKLEEIQKLIVEMTDIVEVNPKIPELVKTKVTEFENRILNFVKRIEELPKGLTADKIAIRKDKLLDQIENFYTLNFTIQSPQVSDLLLTYCTIKSFDKKGGDINNILEKAIKGQEDINTIKENIEKKEDDINIIIGEFRKKASLKTVSDYSLVFKKLYDEHSTKAKKWLNTGYVLSAVFICSFLAITISNILPTEIFDVTTNKLIRYDITNLLSKLIIIAIQIYLISFSFRQFNINKHIATINNHRQNALDSYKLFDQTISKEDKLSHNNLMLQVAKAIYEQTSSGYLSDKSNRGVNSGIVELTKNIVENQQ